MRYTRLENSYFSKMPSKKSQKISLIISQRKNLYFIDLRKGKEAPFCSGNTWAFGKWIKIVKYQSYLRWFRCRNLAVSRLAATRNCHPKLSNWRIQNACYYLTQWSNSRKAIIAPEKILKSKTTWPNWNKKLMLLCDYSYTRNTRRKKVALNRILTPTWAANVTLIKYLRPSSGQSDKAS